MRTSYLVAPLLNANLWWCPTRGMSPNSRDRHEILASVSVAASSLLATPHLNSTLSLRNALTLAGGETIAGRGGRASPPPPGGVGGVGGGFSAVAAINHRVAIKRECKITSRRPSCVRFFLRGRRFGLAAAFKWKLHAIRSSDRPPPQPRSVYVFLIGWVKLENIG